MSNTYSLICRELRVKLWVGQQSSTSGLNLYSGGEEIERLRKFLMHTKFHPIELTIDGCEYEVDMFEEFKGDT